MPWYLDTSAFLKLAVRESGSAAMRRWADAEEAGSGALWSSDLLVTEAIRAARRVSPQALQATRDLLGRIALVTVTPEIFTRAGELDPVILRSLDALHLAAAMSLGSDLEGVVTYDERMTEAASTLGIPTVAP